MTSEKDYLRAKRYRQKHADELNAYHKQWVEEHREHVNAYNREYRFRRKLGLPGGKKGWAEFNASKQV